ncbi:hypothetical protein DY000_02037640 [Brassica cretica]|uniref:Uncharacterized protein n=1 Tax=Brassica cretica TaxID=69181 RepID=A0ABQ7BMS2_BRACR|nr:hypothetical protein DY000_02037640 [Brassica cretica]
MGLLGFVNQLLTITPLIGRSFTEICTLHGCYIPGVPRACIAVGNTEPLLINDSIFTIVPSNKPDVFKTPTTHVTGYVFFSPRARYEEEDDESEPTEKQPPTIWCHKDELYHDLQELGLKEEERIVITRMRMDKTIQLDGGGEQQLYDFELKGINLYCFTFTPETDLSLTRLPKKILDPEKKKKKGRVIKDGIVGPIVAISKGSSSVLKSFNYSVFCGNRMSLSTILMTSFGALDVWTDYVTGKDMGFKLPC